MQNLIEVKVNIDVTRTEHTEALNSFLRAIGGINDASKNEEAAYQKTKKALTKKQTKELEVVEPEVVKVDEIDASFRMTAEKVQLMDGTEIEETEAAKAAAEEAPEEEVQEAPKAEVKTIKLETVRAALSQKVKEHRDEIKAKLSDYGTANVTNLDPSKYAEFMDFLEALN